MLSDVIEEEGLASKVSFLVCSVTMPSVEILGLKTTEERS